VVLGGLDGDRDHVGDVEARPGVGEVHGRLGVRIDGADRDEIRGRQAGASLGRHSKAGLPRHFQDRLVLELRESEVVRDLTEHLRERCAQSADRGEQFR